METSNFNLKQSIDKYLDLVSQQGSITSSDRAELTAHLFDATDSLINLGLSQEEAFIVASRRMGDEEVLAQEYSKVNPSVKMNTIWGYLIMGFNLFYSLPSLFFLGVSYLYILVYQNYSSSSTSAVVITTLHVLLMVFIWFGVSKKLEITGYIEKHMKAHPLRSISLSFAPFLISILLKKIPQVRNVASESELQFALRYPVYRFDSQIVEFSYYLVLFSIIGAIISLLFSLQKTEKLTLRSFFERPSATFLIVFGIVLELLAASTRSLHVQTIQFSALIFAAVYLCAAYLVSYYNINSNKYLFLMCTLGIIMETATGIAVGLEKGDTVSTVYYVGFTLVGIILGKFLALKSKPAAYHS